MGSTNVATTFTYDDADQLTGESRTGYAATYTYDGNGNRLTKTLGGVTHNYTYDDGDKLTGITQGGTSIRSYGYDAAGRTTSVTSSSGTTTLAYDYEERVTGITYPTGSNSFTYNGLDTRVSKTDSSGTKTFRRDGVGVTSPVLADGSATYTPGISQRTSGSSTWEMLNHLGTSTLQSDSSGTTTATRTYDAFGLMTASTGTPKGPFGYAGQHGYQEDADSGLKLLGHRYYDSYTGRFITRDPIKDGRNWYVYCDNNPQGFVDPSGLDGSIAKPEIKDYPKGTRIFPIPGGGWVIQIPGGRDFPPTIIIMPPPGSTVTLPSPGSIKTPGAQSSVTVGNIPIGAGRDTPGGDSSGGSFGFTYPIPLPSSGSGRDPIIIIVQPNEKKEENPAGTSGG